MNCQENCQKNKKKEKTRKHGGKTLICAGLRLCVVLTARYPYDHISLSVFPIKNNENKHTIAATSHEQKSLVCICSKDVQNERGKNICRCL
jgi:hypothetical protein